MKKQLKKHYIMKKFYSVLLSFILLLNICCSVAAAETGDTQYTIKIVHTNDVHARVTEDDYNKVIGMPKLKTLIDTHTQSGDLGLVLDSGDTFHGQSIATLVEGESVAKLLGACGYDATTAGNHDWNYGKDRYKELESIVTANSAKEFSILTGNVVKEDGSQFFDQEYLVRSVQKDGQELKVGIFGMIDPSIYSDTAPSNVEGLTFTDMETYAKKAVAELKKQGCQVIIALTHSRNPAALASKIDDVDLWLAGHEHMDIDRTVTTPDGGTAYVVENGYYLYSVGLIEIDCSLSDSGEVTDLAVSRESITYEDCKDIQANQQVKDLLDTITQEENGILTQKVGASPADLDGTWEHVRTGETTLGRAITDAYLLETGADVAFENAGGIRASIGKGDVTYGDILGVMPYGNYIVTKQITGKELQEILEISLDIQTKNIAADESGEYDAWPANSGSYLQVGGITAEYDLSGGYGSRVKSVSVGGQPLEQERLYTIATNNYAAISSDYPQLAEKEETGEFSACDEAFINYFEKDEAYITKSVTTERMQPAAAEPGGTEEPSVSDDPPATDNPSVSDHPSDTGAGAVSETAKAPSPSGASAGNIVETGDDTAVCLTITAMFASAACVFAVRQKKQHREQKTGM